jgi:hypothetical protein
MPGLLSEADWNQMAKRTVPSIQFDNHGRNQAVDLPDFYEDNQVVARTVPGEWTGTLQTGKVDFRAFDDRGAMQFNESLKVSADVNDNLRISSRDGRLTFFKRDGTLRLHDQLARYALLALLPSGDNRFAVEGVSKERILCMRTLVDSSNRRLKIFDLCSGDQLAHFQPNDEGELEPQDRSQEPQASKANQSHCIQTARAGKAAAQFDLTRLDRIIRREPEYRSKKTAILSVGIWQDAGSALVDSRP